MSRERMTTGPRFDPSTGLVSGEIELPGGLPPEPDDEPEREPTPDEMRARDRDPDMRIWRTELLGREDGPGWGLYVDGGHVASTEEALTNGQAHDWARSQLGEGVRFEPVVFDEYAEPALAEGRNIDWVASPWAGRLHGLRSELAAAVEAEREVQA